MLNRLLGREPAMTLGLIYAGISLFGGFVFHLTINEQGALNVICAAMMALIMALVAKSDGLAAALFNLFKAVIAAVIAFGLHLAPELQASVMTFVALAIAYFTRQSITAPLPPLPTE